MEHAFKYLRTCPRPATLCIAAVIVAAGVGRAADPPLSVQQQMAWSLQAFKEQWEALKSTRAFQPMPYQEGVIRCIDPAAAPRVNRTVFGYYAGQGSEGIDFTLLSHLALAFVDADAQGRITSLPLTTYPGWYEAINAAHDQGVQVVLVVRNADFRSDVITNIVRNERTRATLIDELLDEVERHCLDGISVDFEGAAQEDRDYITLFMQELADAFHDAGEHHHISFATPAYDWKLAYDYPALAEICDALLMMQYVYYGAWSETAGPQAPLENAGLNVVHSIREEFIDLGVPPKRLVLLMPYYGYQWQVRSGADAGAPGAPANRNVRPKVVLINENPFANMTYDESLDWRGQYFHYYYSGSEYAWYQGWCDESESIGKKCDLVSELALQGVGMWRLEYGEGYRALWEEIAEHFTAGFAELAGTVRLQGRTNHQGIRISAGRFQAGTDRQGRFVLQLPAGTYSVTAEMKGYLRAGRSDRLVDGIHLELPAITLPGGDANGDATIDLLDLTIVGGSYGTSPPADPRADINDDGRVNLTDLVIVGGNMGEDGPVPWY